MDFICIYIICMIITTLLLNYIWDDDVVVDGIKLTEKEKVETIVIGSLAFPIVWAITIGFMIYIIVSKLKRGNK